VLFCWLVYPHFCRLTPAADGTSPARWIGTAGSLVDHRSLLANSRGGSTLAMVGRHEFDRAVPVPVVVPILKCTRPFTGLALAGKGPGRVIRPVLTVRSRDSEYGLSLETLGRDKDLSTPISSSRDSSVAPRIALPLSAWRISGCCWHWRLPKPLGRWYRSLRQARCTRSAAI